MFNFHTEELPNKITRQVGQKIEQAREELSLDHKSLAEYAYMSVSTLLKDEQGTKTLTITDLIYLAGASKKPLTYFFPEEIVQRLDVPYLTPDEVTLLRLFRELSIGEKTRIFATIRAWLQTDHQGLE